MFTVLGAVTQCRLGFTERTRYLHDFNEAIGPQTPSRLHVSPGRRSPIGFVERERISRCPPRGRVEHWFEEDVIGSMTSFDNLDGNSTDLIEFKSPFDLV